MQESEKICFVIMGFGIKTDPSTGKSLDLDKTYGNIIQPAVKKSGFQCVRADEIQESGLIDKSMYALLMHADLVVADISTYNPNAIYELGIRHAVKPYTTIILKEKDGKTPFDLDHTRIFSYTHLGEDIGADEAKRCQKGLSELIEKTTQNSLVDSPLYDFIKDITPPELPQVEYDAIIENLAERESHIFAIVEQAKRYKKESNFIEAAKLWKKAYETVPTESYFVQQYALATYKAKQPTEVTALVDALAIIKSLDADGNSNDPETLGLTGAIYKRMWLVHGKAAFLKRAIEYYGKGFQIRGDYYTGENFALCLNMMGNIEKDKDEKTYNIIAAKKAREQIIDILSDVVGMDVSVEHKWAYASLANCYYGLDNKDMGRTYEKIFLKLSDADWEVETFNTSKAQLMKLIT